MIPEFKYKVPPPDKPVFEYRTITCSLERPSIFDAAFARAINNGWTPFGPTHYVAGYKTVNHGTCYHAPQMVQRFSRQVKEKKPNIDSTHG